MNIVNFAPAAKLAIAGPDDNSDSDRDNKDDLLLFSAL